MRINIPNLLKRKQSENKNIDNSVIVNPNVDAPSNVDKLFEKESVMPSNQTEQKDSVIVDETIKDNTKKKFNLSGLFKKKPKTQEPKKENKQDEIIKEMQPKKKFNFKDLFKKKQKEEQTIQTTTGEKQQYTVYTFNYQDGEVTTTNDSDLPKEFGWLRKVLPKVFDKIEEDEIEMPVLFYYKKYAVVLQTNLFVQGGYFVYVLDRKYIQQFKEDKNIEPNEFKKANVGDNKTLIQAGALGVILIAIAGIGGYMLLGNKSKPKPIVMPKPIKPIKSINPVTPTTAQVQKPPPPPPPDPRVLSISLIDNLITQLESYKQGAIVRSISINGTNANIQTDWLTFKPNAKGVFDPSLKHIVFKQDDSVTGNQIDIKPTYRTPQCLENLAKLHAVFNTYQSGKISFNVNIPTKDKNIQDIKPLALAYLKLFSIVDKACGYNLNLKSLSISPAGITGAFELWL
jgi:hypothetical protein